MCSCEKRYFIKVCSYYYLQLCQEQQGATCSCFWNAHLPRSPMGSAREQNEKPLSRARPTHSLKWGLNRMMQWQWRSKPLRKTFLCLFYSFPKNCHNCHFHYSAAATTCISIPPADRCSLHERETNNIFQQFFFFFSTSLYNTHLLLLLGEQG